MTRLLPVAFVCVYVIMLGIGTFLEKPAMKSLDAFQINVLTAFGIVLVGIIALLIRHPGLPGPGPSLLGVGIGAIIGIGTICYFLGLDRLQVSVAATIANAYVLVTILLAILFLHDKMTIPKVIGVILTLAGATLLAYHSS